MTGLACQVCGVAAEGPAERRYTCSATGRPSPHLDYDVGTCADCRTLRPEEPGSAVRAALRVLGKDEDDPLAAEAFAEAGVDATAVFYDLGAGPPGRGASGPQRKAFGHVGRQGKAALRRGYARLLDLRVHAASDHDRPVPPAGPPDGYPPACVACGVAESAEWHGPLRTYALTRGPDLVTGCVCDACVVDLQGAGAVGPAFLERAAMRHFGLEWSEAVRIPRLESWVATGLPPQAEPWAWVEFRVPEPDVPLDQRVAELEARFEALEARLP